jgi:hypothetical protein
MKKNKTKLFQSVEMISFFLAIFFNSASAQQIVVNTMANDGQEILMKRDTVTIVNFFPVKQVQDTAYLSWTVQNMRNNGVFILYRSSDGKNFIMIGTKEVFGTRLKNPIINYFKDTSCGSKTKFYRLVYINSSSEYLVSEKVIVANEQTKIAQK